MTVRSAWLLNRDVATPGQNRQDTRLSPLGTMTPSAADPLTSIGGLIPGPNPCNLTMSGMNWTIGIGRGIAQGTSAQGAYPIVVTAGDGGTIAPGHASLTRIDTLWLIALDTLVDSSGSTLAKIEYTQGTPGSGSAATAPAAGTAYLRLWDISVPAGASAGSPPNWTGLGLLTDRRTYTVSVGGIGVGANGSGAYVGQYRDNGGLQRWDGSSWLDRLVLNSAGRIVIGGDTEWYRDAPNSMRTPDSLTVDGNLNVSGIGQRQFARVAVGAEQSVTNSTSLVDATGFTFPVVSGGVYVVRGLVGGAGSTIGDLKIGWIAPASSTFDWTPTMQPSSGSATVGSVITDRSTLAQSQILGTIGTGTTMTALINGLLVAGGAGTFRMMIAQGTADATPSTLKAGSFLTVERVG
ncbi:hypothetical protein [Kitasatospora cheerisanensis]|uniref:Uncharacterized protein n=1 Tax=Kitasatospora cheerisanensis KCTC 2395 TaxID=1348663 RepID=A0A066YZX1_9ACTN|nr:hypothetical protein [Kitasatospora cheerisanensis]KDN83480.1 hypothetical protein KCH_49620 [Kitasatospora cheerisanensis KCTC 2395]